MVEQENSTEVNSKNSKKYKDIQKDNGQPNSFPNERRIKLLIEGFIKEPEYSFHLPASIEQYEDKFGGADKITVKIVGQIGEKHLDIPIYISENGNEVKINIVFTRYITNKKNLSDLPTQSAFYEQVTYMMDKAVEEYNSKFNK